MGEFLDVISSSPVSTGSWVNLKITVRKRPETFTCGHYYPGWGLTQRLGRRAKPGPLGPRAPVSTGWGRPTRWVRPQAYGQSKVGGGLRPDPPPRGGLDGPPLTQRVGRGPDPTGGVGRPPPRDGWPAGQATSLWRRLHGAGRTSDDPLGQATARLLRAVLLENYILNLPGFQLV
jgi:hypothetical protein